MRAEESIMCVCCWEATEFTQQAIGAVREWNFQPAELDGHPLSASVPVDVSFSQPVVPWNRHSKYSAGGIRSGSRAA
ncbi:MAG TPA: hypothetical protein VFZ27_11355 [Terriglobia bacterium]|nr:hypothetical protein [Terriglobia bacterium]